LEAVVFDQASPPIDKACGEGLMPGGTAWLAKNGVRPDPEGMSLFRGIRYIDTTTGAQAVGEFPHGNGTGIRRLHLHQAMVDRAQALGAELHWKTRVVSLHPTGIQLPQQVVAADYVIGCDGLHSTVRKWAGITVKWHAWQRWGIRRHYSLPPWSEHVEVYWADGCEAYVTPVGPNRVGVALLWSGEKARYDGLLERFSLLQSRLGQAPTDSRPQGAGPFRHRVSSVVKDRVLLVGDSAGYVDALTGEGLSLSFHLADAAVEAICAGDPAGYVRAHARITRVYRWTTGLLLTVARRPWLRRRVIRALGQDARLFGLLLAVNDGAVSPLAVPPLRALRLGLRIALARG
jgi:flavin-dependent dehydrogenase